MTTDAEGKREETGEEYFERHRFVGDIIHGPLEIDFSEGVHICLPAEEYKKAIIEAYDAGKSK